MKKTTIRLMALLLALLPLLGAFANESSAATSRVAVIKELTGTVKVKKAGGSKEFTAFKKMSLNEGDILAVGSNGSAVLQFANGTSEDDLMSASANTTLTFSKLSDSKGTTTKVSMLKGTVWSTVKSIKNKDDEFTLETPTAIMGVRGTNLLASVSSLTGTSQFFIASGFGQILSKPAGDFPAPAPFYIYPGQQITMVPGAIPPNPQDDISIMSLENFVKNASQKVIEQFIKSKEAIDKENEEFIKKQQQLLNELGGKPPETLNYDYHTQADLDRIEQLLFDLVGNLAKQARDMNKFQGNDLQKLIDEVNKTVTNKIDLSKVVDPKLSDAEKLKQLEALKKQKELEDKAKKEQDALKQKQDELLKKLVEQKEAQEKANKAIEEEKKKKAKEEYEKQLAEVQRKKFEEESKLREQELAQQTQSATPPPVSGGGPVVVDTSPFELYFNGIGTQVWTKQTTPLGSSSTLTYEVGLNTANILIKNNTNSSQSIASVQYSCDGPFYCPVYYNPSLSGYVYEMPYGETTTIRINMMSSGSSGPSDSQSSGITSYVITVNRSAVPDGLTEWSLSALDSNEAPQQLSWEWVGPNTYFADLNNIEDSVRFASFDMTLKLGDGATNAKLTYEAWDSGEDAFYEKTITWNGSDVTKTVDGLTEGLLPFQLTLFNGSTAIQTMKLWVKNGMAEVETSRPFNIQDNLNNEVPYENYMYNEGDDQLVAYVEEGASSVTLTPKDDTILRIKSVGYMDSSVYPNPDGSIDISLPDGNASLYIVMMNPADPEYGYLYYNLAVTRLPNGVAKWYLDDYELNSNYWTKLSGQPGYYVEAEGSSVSTYIQGKLGATVEVYSGSSDHLLTGVEGNYTLSGLQAGLNLFTLKTSLGNVTKKYDLIIKQGNQSQIELLKLNNESVPYDELNASINATTYSPTARVTLGTSKKFVTVKRISNGTVINGASDSENAYDLSLVLGVNKFEISIENPINHNLDEVITLTINYNTLPS
ncbi:FecR domain-containing protein [Cohnella soli]|uniref:FecR domain-containing protein n=1 Tax=Cohnella soli TaxID=425005 RepID=A0ABW0I340_9BACL